ncbi:bifunctional phosphopantothenoylcysteine decarboxylase/phosphopantothenate--cysteine ligase CoaBC [Deltaproteobacteria bacterium PRO3]|nr:bifunctional phosphopantothenoylcysteine decarboxylase/phosphopantothenate--cysteine ligase CoaBC [Deltaproteobacteria bacterium PRO3]
MSLKGKKILLGVGGGIAAYKSCELLRRLTERGADVHVVLTPSAQQFVTALTFQALSQHPVHTDLFSLTEESEMSHIKLADEADLLLIAPATADLIAKLAHGIANDLLTTVALVTRAPVFFAPSMNVNMWEKDVVQNNVQTLLRRGYRMVEPAEGYLACGWEGKGRLAEPEVILSAVERHFSDGGSGKKKSLAGLKVLINAGPTREFLDPVRFLSNPSSGKMGFALAEAARRRGAEVTLVAGPVALPTPEGVRRIDVVSSAEMREVCEKHFPQADLFIGTAAVGDFAPAKALPQKLKKNGRALRLELQPTTDILLTLGKTKRKGQVLVGFAAETEALISNAKEKLKKKNLDLIVANDVSQRDIGFAGEDNCVTLIDRGGKATPLEKMPKTAVAERILDAVEKLV